MLSGSNLLGRLALVTSLLTVVACYTGGPQESLATDADDRVALLNPLDKALALDQGDTRPRFIAGQLALNIAVMPEAQRPEGIADAYAAVAPETVQAWQTLEADVDAAVEDFWQDVAESPEFDTFRAQWLECIDEDATSQVEVLRQIVSLHESGEHDQAIALEAKADGCTSTLADSFNAAAGPVYQAWADANAPLMKEYRTMVMGAATDFTTATPESDYGPVDKRPR